jgi:integrase/recombinase XerD
MRTITVQQRRRAMVRRHHLAGDARSPEAATQAVVALHATDPASVYLSVLARSAASTLSDVADAMYARRKEEVNAMLAAPDRSTWTGRRDHALLLTAIQTGLRVSELTGLRCQDIHNGADVAYLHCIGTNRKERTVPLIPQTIKTLTVWLKERHGMPADPLFPTIRGSRLSRDAVEWLINKHAGTAAERCPTLHNKRITAHVLRHTTAMTLLQSNISTSVIALWLGHEQESTTRGYLHGDLRLKQRAIDRTTPPNTRPGRYPVTDSLLAFLDTL